MPKRSTRSSPPEGGGAEKEGTPALNIRRSIAWTFSEQTLQYGLQFVASIFIARLLTPDEMGVFVLSMSAAAVLISLRTFGIGNYLIREPELNLDKIRSSFGVMLLISWSLGLGLYFGRHLVADFYDRASIADVMAVLALSFIVSPIGAPAFSLMSREMRFKALHNIGFASSFVNSGLGVLLAYLGYSSMALAWGLLASTTLHSLLCLLAVRDRRWLRPSLTYWRQIVCFGGTLSLSTLIATANADGIKFLLGAFMSPAGVAQFGRATQVPRIFRQGIFAPVSRVLTPAWSEDIRKGRPIAAAAEKLVAANTVLVWPAFLAMGLIAEPFIILVYGENWRPAGQIFPWILLSHALLTLLPQPEQVLIPYGRAGAILRLRSLAAAFSLSTGAYGASLGLEAFAISRVAAACFLMVLVFITVRPLLGVGLRRFAACYLRAGFVALLAAVPALAFHLSGRGSLTLPELLTIVAASAALWLLGIVITRHFVWGELRLVARRAFGH
ncbi:oligosaccharide flippase family protein [Pelagibius marinus]|uniref:oligosaccharide flippase family protein n=1 Tax=Pelagibius marinus TaxID=2762760 RepID=UPI001872AC9C|nr:oligosaccharide flippase family protein [Pelagibius marinus]